MLALLRQSVFSCLSGKSGQSCSFRAVALQPLWAMKHALLLIPLLIGTQAGGGTLEVRVEARSFVPFDRVEVVYNGRVVASREAREGTREMVWSEQVRVSGPGWLAARCASRLSWPPWPPDLVFSVAAHTSPVYLLVSGQELLAASSAGYLLKLIDGAQSYVENLATRPDPERLARVLKVFEEARSQLRGRMSQHGISS